MKKVILECMIAALLAVGLAGCTKKKDESNLAESEGDIEITIPDDQESGGE